MERGRFETKIHRVCNCSTSLCLLDIEMTLIFSCKVCIIWPNFKIIFRPLSVIHLVACLDERCGIYLISVISKLTLSFLCPSSTAQRVWMGVEFLSIYEGLCSVHQLAAQLISFHPFYPHLQLNHLQGKAIYGGVVCFRPDIPA